MGNGNELIKGSSVDTAAGVAAPVTAFAYGHGPTATFTTTSTTTSIPSITSPEAASTTAELILILVIKPLKKWARANTVKKDAVAASTGFKPLAKKTRRKKVAEGNNPSKKPQLVWLEALSKAFLEYLKLLVT